MKQYLLSVHGVEGSAPRPPDEMQKAYEGVAAFNAELQAAGAWVFAGGLHPPNTATVVREKDGELLTTDGPFVEGKEHIGGGPHAPRRLEAESINTLLRCPFPYPSAVDDEGGLRRH